MMVVFCVFEWCLYKKSIVAPGISGLLSVFFALFAPNAFPGAPGPMIFPLVVRNEGHPATYDLYFILNTTLIGGAKLVPMCVSMPISFRPPSTHHFRHHIRRFFPTRRRHRAHFYDDARAPRRFVYYLPTTSSSPTHLAQR